MAVSVPEVMYGAYYPYLYGRGAARSFHHAPHFQYDRFNVQTGNGEGYGHGAAAGVSSGSASSGAQSPGSPPHAHPRLRAKEEELSAHGRASADGGGSSESEGECAANGRARAQYVSANCVVFTHYSGDVAAVVDEHFARALASDKPKESVPMVSRNLPASFFNAAAAGAACGVDLYDYDPWHQHYSGYGHAAHRHAAEYHAAAAAQAAQAHNMAAAGYPPLLLGRSPLHAHAQYKPVEWQHGLEHAPHHAPHAAHAAHAACSPYSYPAVPGECLLLLGRSPLHAHAQYKPVEWQHGLEHAPHHAPHAAHAAHAACSPYSYPAVPGECLLLLGRSPLHAHAQYKPVEWQHGLEHAPHHAPHAAHAAHAACSPYSYPAVPGECLLLLGRSPLHAHAQYKPVEWQHGLEHAPHHAPHAAHAAHAACSPYSYPAVPGLEAQVQDTSKDLYWF